MFGEAAVEAPAGQNAQLAFGHGGRLPWDGVVVPLEVGRQAVGGLLEFNEVGSFGVVVGGGGGILVVFVGGVRMDLTLAPLWRNSRNTAG